MPKLIKALPLLFLFAGAAWTQGTPVDCTPNTYTITSATTTAAISNSNSATPCVSWRVTYNSTGFSALSIQIETSPNNSSWTAVTNSVCSSTIQPPCVIDGANPTTTTTNATFAVRAYGRYVRLNVTSVTGSGTITARVFGYKGLSANGGGGGTGGGGGSGTVTSVTIAGASNQLTTSGTCTGTTIINCTLQFLNAAVTFDASGNLTTPGSVTTGSGGGVSGRLNLRGSSTGSAAITVPAAAGSPTDIALPITTAGANLATLQSDGGSPQQTSWAPAAGTGADVVRSSALGTSGNCMQWGAVGATDAGSPCGSGGGGGAGSTLFSTTASTTVTAASATTLIGAVTGSTTVAANTFTAGSVTEVMAQGFYTSTGSRTLNIQLFIGGSSQIATGAVTVPGATLGTWQLRCAVTTRTAGVSGTQIANCMFLTTGATLTAPGDFPMQTSATWSVDTTGTIALDLKAAWDSTTGAPTITATNVAAWIPGPQTSTTVTAAPPYLTISGTTYCGPLLTACTVPTACASGWTWVNQSTGSCTTHSNGDLIFVFAAQGADKLTGQTRAVGATFTLIAAFEGDWMPTSSLGQNGLGLIVTDGTKFITFEYTNVDGQSLGPALRNEKWTDKDTGAANYTIWQDNSFNGGITPRKSGLIWLKLVLDATNLTWSYSFNGIDYNQFDQRAKGDFLGSITAAGVGGYMRTAGNMNLVSLSGI